MQTDSDDNPEKHPPSDDIPSNGTPIPLDESSEVDGASLPEDEREEEGVAEDHKLQGSPHATATNAALRALSRTARSFLIYDSHNEAIRQFLGEYERTMREALSHGPVALEVRPFDLLLDGALEKEVVYVQRERGRSLAFRMYRDGVRRLVINPSAEWSELLRLLEILSIRYTGVRQHEDDIVTLLWKAGFQHIEAVSVEGFVLAGDEEDEERQAGGYAGGGARQSGGAQVEVPSDWDRPLPRLATGDPADLAWQELEPSDLESLQSEVSSRAVATQALTLCQDMLHLASDPRSPTQFSEVEGLLDEVRNLLLADGQLDRLLELARTVSQLGNVDEDIITINVRRFVDERALGRILHSAARGDGALPEELIQLLDLAPGDHLDTLLRAMAKHRAAGSRALAERLIAREVERNPQQVAQLVATVEPDIGASLLNSLIDREPELSIQAVEQVIALDVPEFQPAIFHALTQTSTDILDAARLFDWLRCPVEDTRVEVIRRIGRSGDSACYAGLKRHLDSLRSHAHEEAIALGIAMADVAPERTLEELGSLVRPRTFLARMRGSAVTGIAVWAGVSGLGRLPGEYPETAIRWQMERASEALYKHCQKTLYDRRVSGAKGEEGRIVDGNVFLVRGPVYHPGELVVTGQMLCFVPTRAVDRFFGVSNLDIPIRTIDSVEVDDGAPSMTLQTADRKMKFVRGDVVKIGTTLMSLIGGTRTPSEAHP